MGLFRRPGRHGGGRRAARIALFACAMLSPLAVPQAADAALATCEPRKSGDPTYHAGFVRSTSGPVAYGVKATITAERGALCGSDLSHYNFNTVYVMLAEPYNPDNPDPDGIYGWAQVGYHRFANEVTYHYYQYRHGNPPPGAPTSDIHTEFYFGTVAGEVAYDYAVRYHDPCECLVMGIDGSIIKYSDFDPFVSWAGSGPWSYQISGETRFKASDMPGSPTDKVEITKMLLYSSVNQYYTMPCGALRAVNDNTTRWATSQPSCNTGQIWTK